MSKRDELNPIKHTFRVLQFVLGFLSALTLSCANQNSLMNAEDIHKKRADEYYRKGEYEKAKQELLWVLKAAPDDVKANFRLGVIYGNEGSVEKSREAFKKVLSLDPGYSKAYYNLAVLYTKGDSQNDVKQSIQYFSKYLEIEPNSKHRRMIEKWKWHANNKANKGVEK
jgi:tetratricopeptide (TPR) repeat protein